ncbi:DUF2141 domain-containing protein [Cesiribacter andamanensis]|nr:DUF2141 domain-containing protein [Cesiribacter andamanensis]
MQAGNSFKTLLTLLFGISLSAFSWQALPVRAALDQAASGLEQSPSTSASLHLTVEGLRNNKGLVRISLFNSEDGFPEDNQKALKVLAVAPKGGKAQVAFGSLPAGTYAIALLHDENENGKMDTNLVGYPKEGWGASADQLPTFRAPRFQEAAFELKEPQQQLTIRIRY